MDSLRHQTDLERKERARAALRVTENIAQEREGIVTQVLSDFNFNVFLLTKKEVLLSTISLHNFKA
jgi:hypothetical protein